MRAALRFLWHATRGHRLRPWRSEFLRWRIETYSGAKAEELTRKQILRFVWAERGNLARFLYWTTQMDRHRKQAQQTQRHG